MALRLFLLGFLLSTSFGFAQREALGSWNILNVRADASDKIQFFGEAQLRSLKFYDNFHYYEVKGGITYKVNPKFNVSFAGGNYVTYAEGGDFVLPKNNDEIRIWPQIVFLQSIGKFNVEHRYRAEGRFTSFGYRNRFRLRFGVSRPIVKSNKLSAGVYNELFFTNREPYFERNRFLANFNYSLSATTSLTLGYIYQFDYRINDETGTNFLVVGLNFRPKKKE